MAEIIPLFRVPPDWATLLEFAARHGVPVTRERLIRLNWANQPPEEWDGECEDQLPPWLRLGGCPWTDEPSAEILPFKKRRP
ncbi:hypothetical protein [Rhodoblastus sp.]|uniref:hypothetical protein n=1 Tax=Rhodoblastus sp. TaxID=1962975 RepID=UPI002636F54D|nr:hypothetical protein [Rhodoblastus sp.]